MELGGQQKGRLFVTSMGKNAVDIIDIYKNDDSKHISGKRTDKRCQGTLFKR